MPAEISLSRASNRLSRSQRALVLRRHFVLKAAVPVWVPGAGWFGRHLEVGDQTEVAGGPHASGWLIKGEKAVRHLQGRAVGPRTAP